MGRVFFEPVDTEEYKEYLTVVKRAMDLQTVRERVERHEYADTRVRRLLAAICCAWHTATGTCLVCVPRRVWALCLGL